MNVKADIVIKNSKIFTSDPENPQAQAVGIKANQIIFVGNDADAKEFIDSSTRVIDGKNRTLTPGFIDSHFHLLWGSIWAGSAQLYDVKNLNELREILLDFAKQNKTNNWVDGRGIKYGIVSSRKELDEIISDRPVYINAYDG